MLLCQRHKSANKPFHSSWSFWRLCCEDENFWSGLVILSKPFSELTLLFSHETLLVGQKTLKAVCNHIAIGCAHDGVLPSPTASVNKALPRIASGIVENYGDLPAMLAEEPKHPKKI
jgi:hypothetical protein